MIIPIRTETPIHRTPRANYALIAVNVLVFVLIDVLGSAALQQFKQDRLLLQTEFPSLHQFVTYQFLHGGAGHLLGNMLFLWVFGNAVNAKLGNIAYVLFYLAGGVFAAIGFSLVASADLLGASGSIAAVTTAYLVLYPRSRITVLYWMFFVGTFELPAMIMIGIKIILWDNVVAPSMGGSGNVATQAHLAGYAFGFFGALGLLLFRALPRDQFDLLALLKRWKQRQEYRALMADPEARARAQYGQVARTVPATPQQQAKEGTRLDRIGELRAQIAGRLLEGDTAAAANLYEQLMTVDPEQTMADHQQIAVSREFYATGRFPQAAAAFERYLARYGSGPEAAEIRLLLGIVYARDLRQYEAAEGHLTKASGFLSDTARRDQCRTWLDRVRAALGRPANPPSSP